MKRIITIICLLIISNSFSQNDWLTIDLKNNDGNKKPLEVINVVDDDNANVAIFFKYSNFIRAYLYDENHTLINQIDLKELPRYSSNFLGCSRSNNVYTLFFKNLASTKYSSLTVSFENRAFSSKDNIGISLKKETFVESFEDNNQVYILTSINKSSKLKLHTLSFDGSFDSKLIDLSSESFEKPNGIKTSLNTLIRGLKNELNTNSIKVGEPSSLEIASSKNKLYYDKNLITFTSNYFDNYTYIITINVLDGSYNYSKFDNLNFNEEDLWNKANSFIYHDYFFNMYVTRKYLTYNIHDLKTKELIKTLTFDKEDSISFKNSPIILEGGEFSNYRELDHTAQFLRKVTNSNVSTFVYENGKNFVITIGSSEPKEQAQIVYVGGGLVGGLIAGVTNALLTTTYHSYVTTKSTRIECLFDDKFNHISGQIPFNGFDKIKNYVDENDLNKAPLQSVFKYKNDYVFGCFNKELNIYKYTYIENDF